MVLRFSDWIHRVSNGWTAVAALAVFVVFAALVLPGQSAQARAAAGEAGSPDLSLYYTPAELYRMAAAYSPAGRQAYLRARFTFDLAWPLVYTLFLCVEISWLFQKAAPLGGLRRRANLVPLLAALFDYLENLSAAAVMLRYPALTPGLDGLAGVFTLAKWLLAAASFLLLLAAAGWAAWRGAQLLWRKSMPGNTLWLILCAAALAGWRLALPTLAASPAQTWTVTSAADSGPGTLRQALLDAAAGDVIQFSPQVFPPQAPVSITLLSPLPAVQVDGLVIDASQAGVILDGSQAGAEMVPGLAIHANGTAVRGLQIVHFSGNGVEIHGHGNAIGGDRQSGAGPLGEGNLVSANGQSGIALFNAEAYSNTVRGNLVGVDLSGLAAWSNARDGIHINSAGSNLFLENVLSGNQHSGVQACCSTGSSRNAFRNNLIGVGVDGQTPIPNQQTGVWLHDGASYNVIGPGNTIAHNPIAVQIQTAASVGNTLSRNRIYQNGLAIVLADGGNAGLAAPQVLAFDLAQGKVWGRACPGCRVEIFSDQDGQGEQFEGETTADETGMFFLDSPAAFTGPHLTATATDALGSTSPFSACTTGSGKEWVIQAGSLSSLSAFSARCSAELSDNRLGTMWGHVRSLENWGDFDCDPQGIRGLKMVKLAFNEVEDWPSVDWSLPEFTITPQQDAFVTDLADSGVRLTYLLNFWDKANHPAGWGTVPSRFTTEEEVQRYLEYVRFIVRHFKDRIDDYELWNEPDNTGSAIQHIRPEDYIELVRRTAPVIHQEHPAARVVVGSVSYLINPYSRAYLDQLVQSDVMPLVDVVAWHPMYGTSPDFEAEREYYYAYPATVADIKAKAAAHGFRGEFRGDELSWCSPDLQGCGAESHMQSNAGAAKYYSRGIAMHLGMDLAVHLGSISALRQESSAVVSNLATAFAGAQAAAFPIQAQTAVTGVVSYTFSLPGGGWLAALWRDVPAVDDDPGTPITLTLPGLAGSTAAGLDPLHSLHQPLHTRAEGGALVVPGLVLKDYAMLVMIAPESRVYLPAIGR